MLDGYQRGVQIGGDVAMTHPGLTGNNDALLVLASNVLAYLKREGYAYIEPYSQFIKGFADGFQYVVCSRSA